jgi:hypothetical protein
MRCHHAYPRLDQDEIYWMCPFTREECIGCAEEDEEEQAIGISYGNDARRGNGWIQKS